MMAKLQASTTTSCRVARAVSGSSQSSSICPDSTLWKNPLIALTVSRARRKMSRTANSPGMAPRMPVPNFSRSWLRYWPSWRPQGWVNGNCPSTKVSQM